MEPIEVVQALYASYATKDEQQLRQLIHEDVEWNQCEGFPGGARRKGIEDVLSGVLHGNRGMWTGFAAEIGEYIVSGGSVVVLGTYSGTHAVTGKGMSAGFVHIYRVEGKQVIRFDQYADTWPMVRATQA
ncbi:MAG: ketosteroid isomerase-like protein [Planctomycetota bacterium]|jgi:ketosteroid isomerase-like protein